ncbi:hypothetical protein B0H16DRAFT_1732581 [Mycena metata]|uniref:Uncharacterized protein n=1 Tax=Mycena metata TaxID=1033252 RepID=A0AAD7MTX3_9AGAR|nr:hypothetical protein B0H16DRAFT_1732581 [Mycena metata]
MSDDESYQASSSPSRPSDVEPSQAHQYIRDEQEANYTEEERRRAVRVRHYERAAKRARVASPPPVKRESSPSSAEVTPPRSTAIQAKNATRKLYEPLGMLDSQTGDNTCVNHLIDEAVKSETPPDEIISQEEEFSQSDLEMEEQIRQLKARLELVVAERDQLQQEYAAAQASALVKLAQQEIS